MNAADGARAAGELEAGARIAQFLDKANFRDEFLQGQFSAPGKPPKTVYTSAALDMKIFSSDGVFVESIRYGSGFPGAVNQVRIGMAGKQVEDILGPPHRVWPMPHPNIILLYDRPHFFRVDLERDSKRVIAMYK